MSNSVTGCFGLSRLRTVNCNSAGSPAFGVFGLETISRWYAGGGFFPVLRRLRIAHLQRKIDGEGRIRPAV